MLAHTDNKTNSINNYKNEILPKHLLVDGVYITRTLNILYVEEIANIQC